MSYAEQTTVPVERTKSEIDLLLRKRGADALFQAEEAGVVSVGFRLNGWNVLFRMPLPTATDKDITHAKPDRFGRRARLTNAQATARLPKAIRSRWRGLLLCMKAKFESVDSGIETFEQAFLANVMLANGRTVGDFAIPQMVAARQSGTMPRALLGPLSSRPASGDAEYEDGK